jgi:hypothetical protein
MVNSGENFTQFLTFSHEEALYCATSLLLQRHAGNPPLEGVAMSPAVTQGDELW